jgi:putative transcriptional regulator
MRRGPIKPVEVKSARKAAGLTQAEAGFVVGTSVSNWRNWEQGRNLIAAASYELFLLKTGQLTLSEIVSGNARPATQGRPRRHSADSRLAQTTFPMCGQFKHAYALDINESMGTRIRALREAKALTQTDLAIAVGVTKTAVSAWETGQALNIRLQTFLRVLNVLGVSKPEDLIWGTQGPVRQRSAARLRRGDPAVSPALSSKYRRKTA